MEITSTIFYISRNVIIVIGLSIYICLYTYTSTNFYYQLYIADDALNFSSPFSISVSQLSCGIEELISFFLQRKFHGSTDYLVFFLGIFRLKLISLVILIRICYSAELCGQWYYSVYC
ncbi:unnamed protein product [Brugia timori]|uniref:Uncharacterized protein n=1 Tax=Brugia timori TaxID=42155 RepID=A0A0R3QPT5_9BILA|nr:unnamed protein product [Brugia timori]